MSEKKTKQFLNVPVYDLKSQADYLKKLSDDWHVPLDLLVGCIFADFIVLVEEGLLFKEMNLHELAVSYFKHAVKQKKSFEKIRSKLNEVVKNESE